MDPDAGVGAKVVDIPFRTIGVRIVAKIREEKDRLIVVCSEGAIIHRPDPMQGGILPELDVDVLSYRRIWIRSDRKPRRSISERILPTS
jgi:hypothetical protein